MLPVISEPISPSVFVNVDNPFPVFAEIGMTLQLSYLFSMSETMLLSWLTFLLSQLSDIFSPKSLPEP